MNGYEYSVAWKSFTDGPYDRRFTEASGRKLTREDAFMMAHDMVRGGIPAKVEFREVGEWK